MVSEIVEKEWTKSSLANADGGGEVESYSRFIQLRGRGGGREGMHEKQGPVVKTTGLRGKGENASKEGRRGEEKL